MIKSKRSPGFPATSVGGLAHGEPRGQPGRGSTLGLRIGKDLASIFLGLVGDLPRIGYLDQSRQAEGHGKRTLSPL